MNLDGSCNVLFILVNPTRVKLNASSHTQTCIQVATSQAKGFRPHNPHTCMQRCNLWTNELINRSAGLATVFIFEIWPRARGGTDSVCTSVVRILVFFNTRRAGYWNILKFQVHTGHRYFIFFQFFGTNLVSTCWTGQRIRISIFFFFSEKYLLGMDKVWFLQKAT
jgi:hypothetical protein